jgi:hypothetical protein
VAFEAVNLGSIHDERRGGDTEASKPNVQACPSEASAGEEAILEVGGKIKIL